MKYRQQHCRAAARLFSFFSIAFLLAFQTASAFAQSSIAGTVTGQVTDESGAAVPGVAVKLLDVATSQSFDTVTNDHGNYNFPTVPPGKYNINFVKQGFNEYQLTAQEIKIGVVFTANAKLKIGATTTTVEVTASAGAELQTMNATVGNTMNQTSLIDLPNLGRDATTMAVLQPATTPSGYAAGAINDQNTYQLDGANISDDMAGTVTTYETNFNSPGVARSHPTTARNS